MGKVSSLDQIKSLIRRWELSGLSKSSFCRDQLMSYYKFNYWQKRLGTPKQTLVCSLFIFLITVW